MDTPEPHQSSRDASRDFVEQSRKKANDLGLAAELIAFLKYNKKWWLLPIIIALIFIGLLVILGGSVLAPLIYPLF